MYGLNYYGRTNFDPLPEFLEQTDFLGRDKQRVLHHITSFRTAINTVKVAEQYNLHIKVTVGSLQ